MTKYQFDIYQPYILHRSKAKSYFGFYVAAIGLIGGLLSRDFSMLGIRRIKIGIKKVNMLRDKKFRPAITDKQYFFVILQIDIKVE